MTATIRECDCHHRRHRDDSLVAVIYQDPEIDVPSQVSGGVLWYCQTGWRQREQRRKGRDKRRKEVKQ